MPTPFIILLCCVILTGLENIFSSETLPTLGRTIPPLPYWLTFARQNGQKKLFGTVPAWKQPFEKIQRSQFHWSCGRKSLQPPQVLLHSKRLMSYTAIPPLNGILTFAFVFDRSKLILQRLWANNIYELIIP